MSASTAMAQKSATTEILNENVMRRANRNANTSAKKEEAVDAFANIQSNPFFATAFNPNLDEEQRRKAIAQLMSSSLERRQDRERVAQYEEFREFLSAQATALSRQIIALTNVDSMAELQSVIKDMNDGMNEFEDEMKPILEIIEAVYALRTSGHFDDIYREIREDQERDAKNAEEAERNDLAIRQAKEEIESLKRTNFELGEKRSFFGFGGVKESARAGIAMNEGKISELNSKIDGLEAANVHLRGPSANSTEFTELAMHKDRLRELIDLSRDENRDRMVRLRDSATGFIDVSQKRTGSLRHQFGQLFGQIQKSEENSAGLTKIYAILNDGLNDAAKMNAEKRVELGVAEEGESLTAKTVREERLEMLDSHVEMLKRSAADTMVTYGDLMQSKSRVSTMKQATEQQMDMTRKLNTQGIAATADRLATALTAVGGAGLGQASAAAQDTLQRMRQSTNNIASREVIRVAMGVDQINDQMEIVFNELSEMAEVQRAATGIARSGLEDIDANMKKLVQQAQEFSTEMKTRLSIASELDAAGTSAAPAAATQTGFSADLFARV